MAAVSLGSGACAATVWSMASLRSALPPEWTTLSLQSRSRNPTSSSSSSQSISCSTSLRRHSLVSMPSSSSWCGRKLTRSMSSSGSAHSNPLKLNQGFTDFIRPWIQKGLRILAMRHGRRVPKLNRPPDQRRALLRCLTTQLLKHGRIKTTRARASAMRKYVDKMITLAKDGSLHKRRQALGFIYEKQIVHALFAEVQERYGERNGGYTRILRTMPRKGDNAPMAYIQLV